MELTHEFRVAVPPAQAWAVLTDVERIAPCMPGAQLQEIEGEEFRGLVKVKVGPITAQYKGKATFLERDESAGRLVLRAEGRDTRGQGNANATITATLVGDGDGTKVTVGTDLTVTGKVAQFGRGVMADVSAKLLQQFVTCLEAKVLKGDEPDAVPAPAPVEAPAAAAAGSGPSKSSRSSRSSKPADPAVTATATEVEAPVALDPNGSTPAAPATAVRKIDHPEPAPVDLIDTAGGSIAKRVGPIVALMALLFVLLRRRRRRARRGR
jgi:carbon monoxide dehydrogenase subunit G